MTCRFLSFYCNYYFVSLLFNRQSEDVEKYMYSVQGVDHRAVLGIVHTSTGYQGYVKCWVFRRPKHRCKEKGAFIQLPRTHHSFDYSAVNTWFLQLQWRLWWVEDSLKGNGQLILQCELKVARASTMLHTHFVELYNAFKKGIQALIWALSLLPNWPKCPTSINAEN